VRESHVADAEVVVVTQKSERVFDGVAAFDTHECGDLVFVVGANDVVGSSSKDEVFGMRRDYIGSDSVDHLKSAIGGVISVDVPRIDINSEELCTEKALHSGKVCLAGRVRCGDIVAGDCAGGDVVVCVNENGFACDAIDFLLCRFVGLLGDEGKSKNSGSGQSMNSLRREQVSNLSICASREFGER
jgi:hypothetical protein